MQRCHSSWSGELRETWLFRFVCSRAQHVRREGERVVSLAINGVRTFFSWTDRSRRSLFFVVGCCVVAAHGHCVCDWRLSCGLVVAGLLSHSAVLQNEVFYAMSFWRGSFLFRSVLFFAILCFSYATWGGLGPCFHMGWVQI